MFNIGSFEVLLIFVIALLVLGPEKLPGAIRTTSLWVGRFRRSFYKVKAEIEKELNTDEIRRQLHNESVLEEIEDAKSKVESIAKDTKKSVSNLVNTANFDPGASKESIAKAAKDASENERSIVEELGNEIKEAGNQIEDATKDLYNIGKNPKLTQNTDSDQSKQENDIS
ncbi:MAG: twin-arginine translocase subunit TatB [SAR86 cluster bacterium]|uniref:Sec-independent protein translocase protein TatB n=1 Tax=SAR86 cluster bacterium TaxID=2030880 RepID=A0A2A5B494_9GAMM|nr:MAG: twin-arginine translocase subunit TatB [SAR86 cluster bacterium]